MQTLKKPYGAHERVLQSLGTVPIHNGIYQCCPQFIRLLLLNKHIRLVSAVFVCLSLVWVNGSGPLLKCDPQSSMCCVATVNTDNTTTHFTYYILIIPVAMTLKTAYFYRICMHDVHTALIWLQLSQSRESVSMLLTTIPFLTAPGVVYKSLKMRFKIMSKTSDGVYMRSVHPWGRREYPFLWHMHLYYRDSFSISADSWRASPLIRLLACALVRDAIALRNSKRVNWHSTLRVHVESQSASPRTTQTWEKGALFCLNPGQHDHQISINVSVGLLLKG